MEVFIGADYKGFKKKAEVIRFLAEKNFDVNDCGAFSYNEGDDFNDPAITVATAVRENIGSCGILICESAHGVTIQANRFKGIRAAHCDNSESAELARRHDDANVLCLSAYFLNEKQMEEIITAFLSTKFENLERRVRRINRLDEGENYD